MIGKTLAHYGFDGLLGEGGSGVVYRGRDLRLERPVAIKVLAEALRDDELAWARLLREARLASQLNHPHIASIYDLGEEDGHFFMVMEYVEGLPLADLIPEGGMSLKQVTQYAGQIAGALNYAHTQGIIHGDLKGSNILITSEGNIKLLDFGLARRIPRNGMTEVTGASLPLAEAGATAGTLPYLAPEVLRGNPTTVQSDVWGLGVLLYQMATGELPFHGVTPFELSVDIMTGTPPKLGQLPEPLDSAIRRALEKAPLSRTAQVRELANALEGNSREGLPVAGPLPARPSAAAVPADAPPAPSTPARRRIAWTAGAALALGALLLVSIHYFRPPPPPAPNADPPPTAAALVPKPVITENSNVKVWVNTNSGTYHCPGTRWYGKTQEGEYMTQKQARGKGYRPAGNRACL